MHLVGKETEESQAEEVARRFLEAMEDGRNIQPGGAINPADAYAFYRILLGRQPSHEEIAHFLWLSKDGVTTYRGFLSGILASAEYSRRSNFMPPNHVLMAELPSFRFWFRTEDREMGVCMALGQYEPEIVALLPKLVSPGDTCLDIGAQTGFFTMHLASLVGPTGSVHAFEPLSASFDVLTKNMEENKFGGVVRAKRLACSSSNGEATFAEHSGMLIASSTGEVVTIQTVRADDFGGGPVNFVKLDVEGHEVSVVQGMSRILTEDRPIILTEVNEYWLQKAGKSGRNYLLALADQGYVSLRVETLERIDPSTIELGHLEAINVLAVPVEAEATIRGRLA